MFKKSFFRSRSLNIIILFISIFYVIIMIRLLFLAGRSHYLDSYRYNLIPLKTIKQYVINREYYNSETWIKNLFGNIILFIPLGLSIPILNHRFLKVLPFLILNLLILLSVELIQVFSRVGTFDVDDIILNILGALIGLVITRLVVGVLFARVNTDNS